MSFLGIKNPFLGRQHGSRIKGDVKDDTRPIKPPFPGYNWEACVEALERDPRMPPESFAALMGMDTSKGLSAEESPIVEGYRASAIRESSRRQLMRQFERETGPLPSVHSAPSNSPESGSRRSSQDEGNTRPSLETVPGRLNLVNYSHEELMQHVDKTLSTVHFGMTGTERFKEGAGEAWDVAGPLVLLAGTAGEVFAFIWGNSTVNAWWIGMSILATVIVLEATFAVVSYKSSTIRNRAEAKSGGATSLDKASLKRYRHMWYTLAVGVGVGQLAFLISAMNVKVNNIALLIFFAVGRTIFTLASDYYTAFVHVRKPTEGEEAKAQQAQRAELGQQLLDQKAMEVKTLNEGTLRLQRAHTEAQIEQDTLRTELEMKKLENTNRIETLRAMQKQADMFNRLGTGFMRAIFDPELPDAQRQKLLENMQGFMGAGKLLPPTGNEEREGPHYRIEEEED